MRKLFAFLPLLGLLALLLPRGGTPCYVTDGGASYYLTTHGEPAEAVLEGLGLTPGTEDRVLEREAGGVRRITLVRRQTVTLVLPDGERQLRTWPTTVGALLREEGIDRTGLRLCCDAALATFDGMRAVLVAVQQRTERRCADEPAPTLRLESPALVAGQTALLCPGQDGRVLLTERVTLENGREVGRELLSCERLAAPRTRIELYGVERGIVSRPTDAPDGGVVETASGALLRYSRVLQCEATAYSCEGRVGTTATGTRARVGEIAVDPRYIPYGTRVYIVSNDGQYVYGPAVAEDCGGFRGWRIDLYFDTEDECWQFGRRQCTVYVIDE